MYLTPEQRAERDLEVASADAVLRAAEAKAAEAEQAAVWEVANFPRAEGAAQRLGYDGELAQRDDAKSEGSEGDGAAPDEEAKWDLEEPEFDHSITAESPAAYVAKISKPKHQKNPASALGWVTHQHFLKLVDTKDPSPEVLNTVTVVRCCCVWAHASVLAGHRLQRLRSGANGGLTRECVRMRVLLCWLASGVRVAGRARQADLVARPALLPLGALPHAGAPAAARLRARALCRGAGAAAEHVPTALYGRHGA